MSTLDKSLFLRVVELPALVIPAQKTSMFMKRLKGQVGTSATPHDATRPPNPHFHSSLHEIRARALPAVPTPAIHPHTHEHPHTNTHTHRSS